MPQVLLLLVVGFIFYTHLILSFHIECMEGENSIHQLGRSVSLRTQLSEKVKVKQSVILMEEY